MPDENETDAARLLSAIPEYDWLTKSQQSWWTVSEVAGHTGVSRDVVRSRCESGEVPGAIQYDQPVGWRMPRSGLLAFYGERYRRQGRAG